MDQSPAAAAQQMAVNKRALLSAVSTDDRETVVDLLDRGVPIDTKDDEGMSLLHLTALGGHVTTMRLLIRRGCNVDSVIGRGLTPLHLAAAKGQTKAVRQLIRNGASKSVVAGKYGTPLHHAAINGHVETAVAMLEEGCLLDIVDSAGATVLHAASQGGNVGLVRELVVRGCDVNAVEANGCTPLHDAAASGRTQAVRELIKLGATKSVVGGNCGTPLHQAALNGHVETSVAMLEEGCPLDIVDSVGATVLHSAAAGGNVGLVRELVVRGCDVNAVKANGCTPLHDAAASGRTQAVRELIKFGAIKSMVDGTNGTPLDQALLNGHVETVEALLEDELSEPDMVSHDVSKHWWSYSEHERVVGVNHGPPFHAAKQILGDFRHQFIADVDANTVVWELLYKDIIPRGVQERISKTDEPKQQNEILHDCLQRTCTKEALMEVCDIIVSVRGHPKMRELGEAMKRRLYTGFTKQLCSELYRKAIKDGPTVTLHISKAMTVGPPRVGKTFLRHLLLGLPLPEDIKSTAVMETPDVVSLSKSTTKASKNETYVASDKAWVPLTAESGMESLLKILHERGSTVEYDASQAMELTSKKETINPATSHRDEDLEDMGIQTESSNKRPQDVTSSDPIQTETSYKRPQDVSGSDPMKSKIGEIHQLLQTIKSDGNVNLQDAHLLQFIDCGGQLAYHDILPIFVNIPAIYLHVFNLSKQLEDCPRDEIRFKDGSDCYSATSALTVAEMMTRSMMTINALACKTVQLPDEVKAEGSLKPHVVFVGTHYDEFCTEDGEQTRKELDGISKELENAMPPMPYCFDVIKHGQSLLPAMFFPVNNCLRENDASQDSEISRKSTQCLKTAIEKVGSVKVIVPVKWYMYQLLEWGRRGQGHKKCYHYRELYVLCVDTGISESAGDFYAMVTYFHSLSLLTHLCGPGESEKHLQDAENCNCMVFTDPSHLFENVTKLYQVQFLEKGYFGNELQSLKCNGILTMSALEKLGVDVEHSCYMDILVQLFIGARLEWKVGEMALFVPSVLANPIDPTVSGVVPQESHESIAIAFKDTSFIPCGVFTGMCARLQSEEEWEICFGFISRMQMKFKVHSQSVVMVFDRTTYIEVIMYHFVDSEDCQESRNTIINAIAESYCFLFHSRDAQSGKVSCSECSEGPYLQLGKTCEHCHKRFAKLSIRKSVLSVSCKGGCDPIHLDGRHHVTFQNICHKAVVKYCSPAGTVDKMGIDHPLPMTGEPSLRKRSPEGALPDQPPAKRVDGCALTGSEGTVEALGVSSSASVVSGGAVATEKSPKVCEGELCGVSWPLAKRRRASDAEGEPSLRKRSPEGARQNQPPAKRVVRCALTGSEGSVESLGVSSSAPVVSGGAVATEKSSPICEGSSTVFAVITANANEESAVRHFLQLGRSRGEVWEGAHECIWKNDPYLKSNKVTVTDTGVDKDCGYEFFTLTREDSSEKVVGIHIKCLQQAAFTDGGAQDTTTTLLHYASQWKLQLTDIFSVGCCSCADDGKSEENLMGCVLLTNQFEAYLHRGKMDGGTMQQHPEVYQADRKWVSALHDHRITKPARQSGTDAQALVKFKDIPVKEVPRIESGPLVVKSDEYAQELRGVSYRTGIEMEAVGFIKALNSYERQGNQNIPKFASVKGVSNFGSTSGKHSKAETTFFGEKTVALFDDERQLVATLHSIALVIRGVIDRYLVPRKVVNPKQLL